MSAPTRCPSCSAAIAPGAAWCSLCHADLRPRLEVRRSFDVVPGSGSVGSGPTGTATATALAPHPVAPAMPGGTAPAHPDADHVGLGPAQEQIEAVITLGPALDAEPATEPDIDHDDDPGPPVRGRHSRTDDEPVPAVAPRSGSGRHARGRAAARRPARDEALADLGVDPGALDTADVDALADQMLTRLAVTEKRTHFFDPDDVPGGKPVFIAGAAAAVVLVLVFLFTLFGFLLGRG